MKTTRTTYAALTLSLAALACTSVERVEVQPGSLQLTKAGETALLVVSALDANGKVIEGQKPTFVSADPAIATVDANGTITAVKSGSTSIGASVGDKTAPVTVEIRIPAKVELGAAPALVGLGATAEVTGKVFDDAGREIPGATLALASGDEAIVSVAGTTVRGVAPGTARVKATFGLVSQDLEVTVSAPAVESLAVEPATLSLAQGASGTFGVVAKGADGLAVSGPVLAWASSDEKVATVDAMGVITAVAPGSATVTVTAGEKSATGVLTVTK